ncbi:hypothetical protein H1P_6630005 [Hyella patelloides LEGE 07179]|uniref:Uncharacterized protein n=1 Tax=Hyella patelloides LEGE 07179 TaxID=945734 RepID=A0A563W2N0_9CYAN|nr:hypothetical protein [Hyella patelloides]VEP17964.1 hypothetical protein H1P_6630005 [Hyella patelloides LEGE 07179]
MESSSQEVVLGIDIIEQDDKKTESIAKELAILCKAINAYHIACGGSGLIIELESVLNAKKSVSS